MSKIKGEDMAQFAELIDSVYSVKEFNQFLITKFDHDLDYYSGEGKSGERYFETCYTFHRTLGDEGFFTLLIAVANDRKGHQQIEDYTQQICVKLGYKSQGVLTEEKSTEIEELPEESGSEKIIDPKKGDWDPIELAEWLPDAVRKVCLISIRDKPIGTGFLVGCDLVLTAYHNISPIIDDKRYSAEDVRLSFGYVYEKDKITLQERRIFNLQPCNWVVVSSPSEPSEVDRHQRALEDPPFDHLDYALLWVAGSPGNETIGDRKRGWFPIVEPVPLPEVKAYLYLLHHPAGVPLKFSEGNDVIRLNRSTSRVDYKTNTKGGSSGAPCFDKNHDLVALHNYGQSNTNASIQDGFNRGIPMVTIVKDLKQKEYFQYINQATPYPGLPKGMEQVVEKIRNTSPSAYPFFNQLNISLKEAQKEEKKPSIQALICMFWNYNWIDYRPSYWLFMFLGLHIAVIGDPIMNKENIDRLIAQYKQYTKIGFDDPRLKNRIQGLTSSPVSPIIQEDKINLEDHYGNQRASLFFRQLAEVLSIRWDFIAHLHRNWPEIYIGSEIIEHSKNCLREIENDIRHTLDIFLMYERVNGNSWSPNEEETYRDFALLSKEITKFIVGMIDEFSGLECKLCYTTIENVLPELEPQYVKLDFFISDYLDVIHDLIDISEASFQ